MKIKWRKYFAANILSRGENYADRGAVYQLHRDKNRYTAMVVGNRAYFVALDLGENCVKKMSCNCPHARDGYNCKHMAAVFVKLEENGVISEFDPPKIERLTFPVTEEYQFYDLQKIVEGLEFTESQLEDARHLIDVGAIELQSIEEGFSYRVDGEVKTCKVRCVTGKEHGKRDSVIVEFSQNELLYYSCNAFGCYKYYSREFYGYYSRNHAGCAHIAAVFMLLNEYLQTHQLGDATDHQGKHVLETFRQKRQGMQKMIGVEATSLLPTTTIKLEPRLDVEVDGSMKLSFRIGDQKLYMVKNLYDLVECVEQKQSMTLGKRSSIHFGTQSFDEASLAFYEFIRGEVKMDQMRAHVMPNEARGDYIGEKEIHNTIPLYGARLDEFFDMVQGRVIPYTDKQNEGKDTGLIEFCTGAYHGEVFIENEQNHRGDFDGIRISGEIPTFISGIHYQYTFNDGKLQRLEHEEIDGLLAMRDNIYSNSIDFVVGRKYLSEFMYRTLPMIEKQATVHIVDRETLEQYLLPEGKYVFYLDEEDDNLTCLTKVKYGETCFVLSQDKDENPARDVYRENEILEEIKRFFPYEGDGSIMHCNCEESLIFNVLKDGVNVLLSLGEVQATERFNRIMIRKKPQVSVGVQMESDLLNLSVTSSDMSEEDLVELLQSYRRKKKFHRLKNGDFVRLDDNSMEELSLMLEMMKVPLSDFVKGKMQIPAYRALYLDKLLEKNDALYTKRDKTFKMLIREFKTVSDSDYEVPDSLQHIMRNYQSFGYKWLRTIDACKFGAILADDMGLGKTLQIIAFLLAAKEENRLGTALIVTPASLVYNWQAEFEKFAPKLSVATITGTKSERERKLEKCGKVDVLITSYDLLKRDIKAYENIDFTYQVIDEAQYIKNHTTATAKSVKVIRSGVRFALTGTPIENRLSELWSIFDFLMPGFLYSYDLFRRDIESPIVKNKDEAAMQRLKRMVEPFILRRLKEDVLSDLPEKIEEVHYVQFEAEQRHLYDGQAVYMKKLLEGQNDIAFQKSKFQILAEITKIRQICCDPGLCFDNYKGESAKRIACMDLIKSAISGEHKVLLFSQFTSLLALLEDDLRAEGISYYKITGETSKEDRIGMVNRFNSDDIPVFLISLKAGGTGLNLTGADIVIHYDPWWNLAAQNQATDRAHRIGQTKTVSVYKLIAKDSIEEKILSIQEQKSQLADEVLAGKQGGLMNMSREELLELL